MTLDKITWDNFQSVINLTLSEEQSKFLPPITEFMAQAYVNLTSGYEDHCFAISEKGLIGFTKVVFVPKDVDPYHLSEDSYMIDALAIDQSVQGLGYGKRALDLIIKTIESWHPKSTLNITLTCYEKNTIAIHFFVSQGFKKIGVRDKDKGLHIYQKKC